MNQCSRHWEHLYLDIIRKIKKGFLPSCARAIFWVFSFPYQLFIAIRNLGYDRGWFSRYTPPIPLVISIGNIVAGGAGKTPVTLMIAEAFYEEFPLAILARGYRSQAEKLIVPVIVSRGQGPTHPASYSGDEAYLMAQRLPNAFVVVGRNRRASSQVAAKLGAKLILLDDGMQHRRIQRDKEIVVMDMNDPWGLGYYLPRGLLREGKSGLKRADLIVINHTGNHKQFEKLKMEISAVTSAPVVGTRVKVTGIYDLAGQSVDAKGKKIAIFCGIAHPDYFRKTIEELDLEIVSEFFLADHQGIALDKLVKFSDAAREQGAEYLICTEKDKVKIGTPLDEALPILWVKMSLEIVEGSTDFHDFIEKGREILKIQS